MRTNMDKIDIIVKVIRENMDLFLLRAIYIENIIIP